MSDEQAYDELAHIAEELDVPEGEEAPTGERLRELAERLRECSLVLLSSERKERGIRPFLKSEPQRYAGKVLLHVGVGNSALPTELAADLAQYFGITISIPEIEKFEKEICRR